jgi:hypothetical protein
MTGGVARRPAAESSTAIPVNASVRSDLMSRIVQLRPSRDKTFDTPPTGAWQRLELDRRGARCRVRCGYRTFLTSYKEKQSCHLTESFREGRSAFGNRKHLTAGFRD